jgi:hypothetical protein
MTEIADEASNIVVPLPEAESILAASNALLPPESRLTAPAHITLVYPFMPRAVLDDNVEEIEAFFSALRPMSFTLRVGWFGREVLLLEPEPVDGLVRLTLDIIERWPEYPYYGGDLRQNRASPVPRVRRRRAPRAGRCRDRAAHTRCGRRA